MPQPKRAVRSLLAPLALGVLALGALTGCAPAQTLSGQPSATAPSLLPSATRADSATLVFRSQTARAGAVDLLLDGTPVLRQMRATDSYRVVALPPGWRTLSVRNALSGTLLEAVTVDLRAGESYALSLRVDPLSREYVLHLGRGSDAVSSLIHDGR